MKSEKNKTILVNIKENVKLIRLSTSHKVIMLGYCFWNFKHFYFSNSSPVSLQRNTVRKMSYIKLKFYNFFFTISPRKDNFFRTLNSYFDSWLVWVVLVPSWCFTAENSQLMSFHIDLAILKKQKQNFQLQRAIARSWIFKSSNFLNVRPKLFLTKVSERNSNN